MDYTVKAALAKKKYITGITTIALLGCVGVAALALAIYSLFVGRILFTVAYLVAFALSALYTLMKLNTVMPSYAACDDGTIYFSVWENDFFPYKTDHGFIGEFIPEKLKIEEIPMAEIKSIFIGSGNFIARNTTGTQFAEQFKEHKTRFNSALKKMEFMLVVLKDGTEKFMPVTDFDPEALAGVVKTAQHSNRMLEFVTGNRHVRRFVPKQEMKF